MLFFSSIVFRILINWERKDNFKQTYETDEL